MAKSCIFHELIELSRDEEISVRIASLETLVDLLDFFEKSKPSIISDNFDQQSLHYYILLITCLHTFKGSLNIMHKHLGSRYHVVLVQFSMWW